MGGQNVNEYQQMIPPMPQALHHPMYPGFPVWPDNHKNWPQ